MPRSPSRRSRWFGVLDLPGATASTLSVLAAEAVALVLPTLLGGVVADRYPRPRAPGVRISSRRSSTRARPHAPHRPRHAARLLTVAFVAGASDASFARPAMTGIVPRSSWPPASEGNALIGSAEPRPILGLVAGGIVVVAIGGGWPSSPPA